MDADTFTSDASPWPDLVLIDGGLGQLNAARTTLTELGVTDVPLVGIAKGEDRNAGEETFFMPDRPPLKLRPRDPLLYFVQRLRDEAHRFAVGSHRQRRKKDIREAGSAGDRRYRADAQTRLAAAFRHVKSDRARDCRRSVTSTGHQRRDRAKDLRFFPRLAGVALSQKIERLSHIDP